MRLEKVVGFIAYSFPLGEADQIVSCFTSAGNLEKFVAKGSRKVKSRFAAAVQPFNLGEYVIYRGNGLPILRQADIIDSLLPIRRDWSKSGAAFAVMELCRLLIAEEAREDTAFRQVFAYLHHLKEHHYTSLAFDAFRLQFAAALGYFMCFDSCAVCGGSLGTEAHISWAAGGAVCSRCPRQSNGQSITPGVMKTLAVLGSTDYVAVDALQNSHSRICADIIDTLIIWLTDGKTKAQAFRRLFEGQS